MLKAFCWCIPGISGVGRSSLLAERSSFSLIPCSTWSIFVTTRLYIVFLWGYTFFFSHDPWIQPTKTRLMSEQSIYCVYVCVCVFFTLNHSSTRRHPAHPVSRRPQSHIDIYFFFMRIIFFPRWHRDSNQRQQDLEAYSTYRYYDAYFKMYL